MNILVTGYAGFIGSHLAEGLSKSGHTVIGIDNMNHYYDQDLKQLNKVQVAQQGAIIIEADLNDDLEKVLPPDIDCIYHLAAQPGISSHVPFEDYQRNNILATQNILQWCKKQDKIPYFINIATSSIYGLQATRTEEEAPKPASDYGVTKLAAEQLFLAYLAE